MSPLRRQVENNKAINVHLPPPCPTRRDTTVKRVSHQMGIVNETNEREKKFLKKNGKKGHFWIFFWYLYRGIVFCEAPVPVKSTTPFRSDDSSPPPNVPLR